MPSFWRQLFDYAKAWGLTDRAAAFYTWLMFYAWTDYHIQPQPIISGRRSRAHNARLQAQWDSGDRSGLKVRPADASRHLNGEAFDLGSTPPVLTLLDSLVKRYFVGVRSGASFSRSDPNHFDVESDGWNLTQS